MTTPTFRIDRFDVPRPALEPFLARLRITQRLLGQQPGCRQNLVLTGDEQPAGVAVVTVVEWADTDAMASAKTAMQQYHAREAFDPAAFMRELGIRPDLRTYRPA